MTDRHKYEALKVRPSEPDRTWLLAHAEKTGRAINAILNQALREYRERHDSNTTGETS